MSNKLDNLLVHAHQVRAWLSQPEALQFGKYLQDYRNETLDKLISTNDTVGLYRLQGTLKVLDNFIELRHEMDVYIKGVADGSMKKVELEKEKTNALGN